MSKTLFNNSISYLEFFVKLFVFLLSCLFCFADTHCFFSIKVLIFSEAFPCNFLIEQISLMSSVQRASPVNDPLTFFIEKGTLNTLPFSFTTCRKTVLSFVTQCVVASCRRPNCHIFLTVNMDLCQLYFVMISLRWI